MTEKEFLKYKSDFKSIVYLKGKITDVKNHIRTLSIYDKNDSHKEAVLRTIKQLDEIKKQFNDKLEGIDYEYMMISLRKATVLYNKSKTKEAYLKKFEEFEPFNITPPIEPKPVTPKLYTEECIHGYYMVQCEECTAFIRKATYF